MRVVIMYGCVHYVTRAGRNIIMYFTENRRNRNGMVIIIRSAFNFFYTYVYTLLLKSSVAKHLKNT